jgi:DNA-binding NarL/FixJ family response regulator
MFGMPKVLVYSPHLLSGVALAGLVSSLGFEGCTDLEGSVELGLWDLCSYVAHYPPPAAVPTLAMVKDQENDLPKLLRMGYRGFMRVHEGPEVLKKALQALRRGEIWAEHWVISEALTPKEAPRLTAQEYKVLLTQGMSNRDIASSLGIGEKTVKAYLSKLFDKLGARNRTDLILQHMKYKG